ncbi:16S rRNA m(2)G 1207 methyltransferase [Pilibacter termitis]|uniref:16S rRNA m(2)G 1207 methyltransferase n=1 Tax=Pilibacter termitis TaxID=263852 RepID=A0A1T4MIU0_9ENTE|nr:class I SAM-dependent methyltransferase [Pilibacter termitis]SJZ66694.1 16S rRNA m(2)G 1207 methyltransferase [Pilibacter termitis]
MSNQYFTNQPVTTHQYETFDFTLRGNNLHFLTDSNVFSKKTIDFGSRVLIEAFSEENLPEGDLLDVGCGYGPIGLSLSLATKRAVEMVDINERAIELAKENAKKNGIERVNIHVSNLYENVEKHDFSAILSNPPIRAGKVVVHEILEKSYDYLQQNGALFIVIQKKQGAKSAMKKMEETFGNVEVITKEKGYFILKSVRE